MNKIVYLFSLNGWPRFTRPDHPDSPERYMFVSFNWFWRKKKLFLQKKASYSDVHSPAQPWPLALSPPSPRPRPLRRNPVTKKILNFYNVSVPRWRLDYCISLFNLSHLQKHWICFDLRCSHLFPKRSFLLQSSPCLLLPLRGEEVPPGVESLVVEDEEDAASKVAEEGGKDANQEEFCVWI